MIFFCAIFFICLLKQFIPIGPQVFKLGLKSFFILFAKQMRSSALNEFVFEHKREERRAQSLPQRSQIKGQAFIIRNTNLKISKQDGINKAFLRSAVALLFCLIQNAKALNSLDIRTCGIIEAEHHFMGGGLSDYWAQELIGADLLREELEGIPAPSQPHFISVFDTFRSHSANVRNLISGKGPQAVLPELEDKISVLGLMSDEDISYWDPFFQLRESGGIPSFINHSESWSVFFDSEAMMRYEGFKSLSPYTIVAVSGGNLFPYFIDKIQSQASKDFNAILVGSLSPFGLVSEFSQEGEEVHILAPSDDYLISADSDGERSLFGGTSGAAPLVTGALAGFEWISGYHPTAEEAKILLEKTAISTLHFHERPRLNGAGVLNAYKISRLAARLSEMCQSNDCFRREIRRDENYLFHEDTGLKEDLARAFPSCSFERALEEEAGADDFHRFNPAFEQAPREEAEQNFRRQSELFVEQTPAKGASCESKAEVFKNLRREYLLSPERGELLESLSCIYREAGFEQNALMMDSLALALETSLGSVLSSLLQKAKGQPNYRAAVIRLIGNIGGEEALSLLKPLIQDEDPEARRACALAAGSIGGDEGLDLLTQLIQDETSIRVKKAIAVAVGRIKGPRALALLTKLAQDEDPEVRRVCAFEAGRIGGDEGLDLLTQLIQDETFIMVKEAVVVAVGRIGGPRALALLTKLAQDEDPAVRRIVAIAGGHIGGEGGLALLIKMYQDKDSWVRRAVATAGSMIGGPRALALLTKLAQDEDPAVRRIVAIAGGHIGGEGGLALLIKMYQDKDSWVRRAVATAGGMIGGPRALALLTKLAQDEDPGVIDIVTQALRRDN